MAPETITIERVWTKAVESEIRIANLEAYQEKQNGHLGRIEDTVEKVENKVDGLKTWIIGLMGSILVGLIILLCQSFAA